MRCCSAEILRRPCVSIDGCLVDSSYAKSYNKAAEGHVLKRRKRGGLERWLLSCVSYGAKNISLISGWLKNKSRVLVVGGGALGIGIDSLMSSGNQIVVIDIYNSPLVDIVATAEDTPFVDGAFDLIVLQSVMQYIADQDRLINELSRLLKAGGLIYIEMPFMQSATEGDSDVVRYTQSGLKRHIWFADEIDSGVLLGPFAVIKNVASSVIYEVTKSSTMYRIVYLVFFFAQFLDRPFLGSKRCSYVASALYYIGRKNI